MEVYNLRSQRLHIQRNVRRLSLLFMRFEFNPNLESWVEANMCLPIFVNNNIGRTQNNLAHLNSHLWYFWGSMDLLAMLLYCVNSVRHDRIPFISDAKAFGDSLHYYAGDGFSILVMFFLCLTYFYYSLCLLRPGYSSSERLERLNLHLLRNYFAWFHSDVRSHCSLFY